MRKSVIIVAAMIVFFYGCTHDHILPASTNTTGNSTTSASTGSGSSTTGTGSTTSTGSSGTGSTTGTGTSGSGSGTTTSATVCFQTDVLPLYQTYCASTGCHNATTARSGIVLTSYSNIISGIVASNLSGSKYYSVISSGRMPPGGSPKLSTTQIATIASWINQGATNNTCTVTATCDTTKTTYSNGISTIFSTYCNGCHGVTPGSGGVVLSDYADAKLAGTTLTTSFLNAINYTSANSAMNMPQSGQLTSCQITQITKWINNGCPQ